MDKIILNNLGFYGYHGVMPEENKLGQKFFVDIDMYLNLNTACHSDDVADTVNYAEVYEIAKDVVENRKYKLIEAVAQNIADSILQAFPIVKEIMVRIKKPEAPVKGIYDYFAVEIWRKNNG